jgi:diadenosine tetraphosphatase ApaH/serine/threonine PP2A family protein phosphatase
VAIALSTIDRSLSPAYGGERQARLRSITPMRAAVITDIHSNRPALEAVLDAIAGAGVGEIWCLGDVVGYGAEPDRCTEIVKERCDLCLVGNHDLAVLGQLDVTAFSPAAAEAVTWTQANAHSSTLDFLRELSPAGERADVGLFHASPRDPVWEYVLSVEQASDCLDLQPQRVALIGHSHVALFFSRAGGNGDVRGVQALDGAGLDLADGRWLVNPGSVGQPRDGDPRAAWLELDTDEWTARYHRVEYEIDLAANAIAEADLPKHLGDRLYVGQ